MEGLVTEAQGRLLLRLARESISEQFSGPGKTTLQASGEKRDPALNQQGGTFVTLKIDGQLRGCIGNLEPVSSIWEGVRSNAVNAAFHDYRFPKLTREELARVHIEISLLSRPQPFAYQDAADLLSGLRPGIDGVVLRLGHQSATFLPQVWDQLPRAEDFLTHLCLKAGLSPRAWIDSHPEVATYQVQHFEEGP